MERIHLSTNVSFLIIFIAVLILAIIQGGSISNALLGNEGIRGNEVQQIAFIILTLFILIVSTLHPDKIYLSSYAAMTLGLIVIISSFFNMFNGVGSLNIFQFIIGIVLILGGVLLFRKSRLNKQEQRMVYEGIKNYKQ